MRVFVHVLGGLALVLAVMGCGWVALHADKAPDANLPMKFIKVITFGSVTTRKAWLNRLRLAYGGMALILTVAAIAVWAST